MSRWAPIVALGLALGGVPGALFALTLASGWRLRQRRAARPEPSPRLFLLLMQIELRSGQSILAALQSVSLHLPGDPEVQRAARLATVEGLGATVAVAGPTIRPVLAQLERARRSGSSLLDSISRLLEQDLAEERARRLARARALPVKLMIPLTVFMLPGLVLLLYAPSILGLIRDLAGG